MPPSRPAVKPLIAQLFRFGLVGVVGFLVDTGVLYLLMGLGGMSPYTGRVFSYLVAATVTWLLHRVYTFPDAAPQRMRRQWALFVVLNGVGALLNYGTYAALVATTPLVAAYPALGVAVGSVIAMCFNYTANRFAIFRAA